MTPRKPGAEADLSAFSFLNLDNPDTRARLTKLPPRLHGLVAHELALAFDAAIWARSWEYMAEQAAEQPSALQAADDHLMDAERLLRRAGFDEGTLSTLRAVRRRVAEDARLAVGRLPTAALGFPPQYLPEVVNTGGRPPVWTQTAIKRLCAVGLGKPTATALIEIAAGDGEGTRAKDEPDVVRAAVRRELERGKTVRVNRGPLKKVR